MKRRTKAGNRDTLVRALERREELLAKLVRLELQIQKLKKRLSRAERKAFVANGDASVAAGMAPSPYTGARKIDAELDDEIPI